MSNEPATPFLLALDDDAAVLELVGGKGASLARMARAGLPVPTGFYVTTAAYRRFVAENDLHGAILAAASSARPDDPTTLEAASARIQVLFTAGTIPDDVAAAIRRAYADLGDGAQAVAVRSSATAEDLPDLSFAGQQETYLNMCGDSMVLDAVKRCWASLWTARAIGYRARSDIAPADVSLAVVVQELVPADVAGILFTANPLTGQRDQMMINAAWGLGEAIVGGQVTPDMFVVDTPSGTILEQQINAKAVLTVRTPDGTSEAPVPDAQRMEAALAPAQAVELTRLGAQIEQLFSQPMDIEWALHDGRIFVLQARPITTLPELSAALPTDWSVPDPRAMYARASIVEMLPDPLSPLFATLSTRAVTQATNRIFADLFERADMPEDWLKFTTINGYAYYGYRFTGQVLWMFLRGVPEMIRFFARNEGEKRWREEFRPRYVQTVETWAAKPVAAFSAAALLAAVEELLYAGAQYYTSVQMIIPMAASSEITFARFYDQLVKRAGDPPAQSFLLGFDSAPIRADKSLYDLAMWSRAQPELAAALVEMPSQALLELMTSEKPPAGVDEAVWHAWCSRFQDHLSQYGRMIYDLDFAKAVPADAPAPLLETLKYYLRGAGQDPHRRQAGAVERREEATRRMLTRLDAPRRAIFRRLLQWAQKNAPMREDALADEGLAWPLMRQMLFELGRRLVAHGALSAADQIFWLEHAELHQAAADVDAQRVPLASFAPVIRQRQAEWRARKLVTPPPLLPRGQKMWGIDLEPWMPVQVEEQHGATIVGVGASAGEVTAVARVIHGPEDFGTLQPGEVLVAAITTPAWTPLFALAAAVVTDVGGPLSHGSIVAREYGIPAVLGTGAATRRIRSGEMIRVNGDAGKVTLLEAEDAAETPQPSPEAGSRTPKRRSGKTVGRLALAAGAVVAVAAWWNIRRRSHGDETFNG